MAGRPLEEKGELLDAILNYSRSGVVPSFRHDFVAGVFATIKPRLDENDEKWAKSKAQKKAAIMKRWHPEECGSIETNQQSAKRIDTNTNEYVCIEPYTADTVNVNVNVNGNVNSDISSLSKDNSDISSSSPSLDGSSSSKSPCGETMTTMTPEKFWVSAGIGKRYSALQRENFKTYRAKGVEDALINRALREAVDHGAKSPWAYAKSILDKAVHTGDLTLTAWEAKHIPSMGGGRNTRVDRDVPSGNDFLKGAMERPRRLKRKG
jgi:hypothetical protein